MENNEVKDNVHIVIDKQGLSGILVIVIVLVVFGFYYFSQNNESGKSIEENLDNTPTQVSSFKKFYTTNTANVRKCASTECEIIGTYPPNNEFTLEYNSIEEMPEWVEFNFGDGDIGFINKVNLSENKVVIVEKMVEKIVEKESNKLSDVIKKWRSRTAYIECTWRYSDTGKIYLQASGSGLAFLPVENEIHLVTNKHVLSDENGYLPDECLAKLPDDNTIYKITTENIRHTILDFDYGSLVVRNPSPNLNKLVSSDLNYCKRKADTGDSVVILGYPSYGSGFDDITATEGIISGYQSPYYTTSAKIEHGNSGGVAILVENNCYLGIPTGVRIGEFESLGRILDIKYIFQLD